MQQCTRCGRQLKTTKSIEEGYGPVCKRKHLKELADLEFEKNQLTMDEVIENGN